ncbi:DUF6715 family protein [Defluviitalea phaphyphila]|uniref:DUF6715 family protein n=1 Tax=Defluviitalea phaphyphila TaxID=1473580 RepID=UPI0007300B8D|nr:DUF6715 family protein [Defluviitalea phaphyphila]
MRKVIGIIIIIFCLFLYYVSLNENKLKDKESEISEFDKIINLNIEKEEFSNPEDVITRNNQIIAYLYGGEVKLEEVETLVILQRNLFDLDLLEINPLEEQVKKVKATIEEYKKNGFKVIGIKQKSAVYEENNKSIAKIKVVQYTNGNTDNYLEYYLRKQEDNTWKILGWEIVDKFEISEDI